MALPAKKIPDFTTLGVQPPARSSVAQSMLGTNSPFASSSSTPTPAFAPPLPSNYNLNDLAGYEQGARTAYGQNAQRQIGQLRTDIGSQYDTALQTAQSDAATKRAALAASLTGQGQQAFDLEKPQLDEELNRQGIYNSATARTQSDANALKAIALSNQDKLNTFDSGQKTLEDNLASQRLGALTGLDESGVSANLQSQQDALDSALNLRSANLEQNNANANTNAQTALAEKLANQQSRNGLTNSLIGGGTALLGGAISGGSNSFLGSLLHGGGAAAGTGAGATAAGSGILGGTALAGGAGAPASSLFPGGLGAVGTGTAGGAGTAGIASALGGGAALAGAGIGAALLDTGAKRILDKNLSATPSAAARAVLNPVGSTINLGKNLLSDPNKTLSNAAGNAGGSLFGGKTANGNDIATLSISVQNTQKQLQEAKDAVARGEISQADYQAWAQPIVEQTAQAVGQMAGRGTKYATPINNVWGDLLKAGLVTNTGHGFLAA